MSTCGPRQCPLHVADDTGILAKGARVAGLLAGRGIVIVSGLAERIDTAAHTAAISRGGRTIAVLGTPLDQVFPRQNAALQDQIMGFFA